MNLIGYLETYGLRDQVADGCIAMGIDLMKLEDWHVKVNTRAKSRYGLCSYKRKTIEVTNEYYVNKRNGDVIESEKEDHANTLLHETAHVFTRLLCGTAPRIKSHGVEWKRIMRALGGKASCTGSSKVLTDNRTNIAKHSYTCMDCGYVHHTQRKLMNLENRIHGSCRHKLNHGKLIHKQLR